jgi:hypothetical protein
LELRAEQLKHEREDFIVWNWVPQFLCEFSLILPEVHLFRGINCGVPCTDVGVIGFPLAWYVWSLLTSMLSAGGGSRITHSSHIVLKPHGT